MIGQDNTVVRPIRADGLAAAAFGIAKVVS